MLTMRFSPEIERIYRQLLRTERRRSRILSAVSSHFGRSTVERILESEGIAASILEDEPDFSALIDERTPSQFLEYLADYVDRHEAQTITALRAHVSVYRQHVDEQILFGSRTAGQEAGRSFLSRFDSPDKGRTCLEIPEAIQAVLDLTYNGLPWKRSHFLCLRSLGGSTIHYTSSPHLSAWKGVGADPKFLYMIKTEWIRGILDILSPATEFSTSQAIEQGNPFGLAHFYLRGVHAAP